MAIWMICQNQVLFHQYFCQCESMHQLYLLHYRYRHSSMESCRKYQFEAHYDAFYDDASSKQLSVDVNDVASSYGTGCRCFGCGPLVQCLFRYLKLILLI